MPWLIPHLTLHFFCVQFWSMKQKYKEMKDLENYSLWSIILGHLSDGKGKAVPVLN
jgi:hypothetical protein